MSVTKMLRQFNVIHFRLYERTHQAICIIPTCPNSAEGSDHHSIIYYQFPSDMAMAAAWKHACGFPEDSDCSSVFICWEHFRRADYELSSDAVPSLFLSLSSETNDWNC